ncbi:hypothetical protein DFH06DRAFT_200714 [Mycena polygramma]|nr:hypothetical protein DFH06DRAFT_200714 [Mycena polygramma]
MNLAILPFAVLFASSVHGKGGGKTSSTGESNSGSNSKGSGSKGSGSSSSTTSETSGGRVTVITTGGTTVCYNENNQIIRCPPNSARKNLIIGAVVGGILGAILLGFLIYCVVMRMKERRRQQEKKTILPNLSFGKQEYKPLHDHDHDHDQDAP